MTKQELTAEYKQKFGKKPFAGWDEEKLKEKLGIVIEEEQKDWDSMTEAERMKEAKRMNTEQIELFDQLKDLTPIMIDGIPNAIIDNQYVPWKDAQILQQEQIIKRATIKLKQLKK